MEFVQMQVKVMTLNKSLFAQLDATNKKAHPSIPLVHGRVNHEGVWFIVQGHKGLEKIRYVDLCEMWIDNQINQQKEFAGYRTAVEAFESWSSKYPQIFI